MDILDFLIFFLWTILFHIYYSIKRKRFSDPLLRSYHKTAFWIRVFSTLAFSLFVIYISQGDTTTLYYPEGRNLYHLILKDPSNIKIIFQPGHNFDESLLFNENNSGFFNEESNFMVTRIVALICFFTFGKFMAINLFFCMIAFSGLWRLYLFFHDQFPLLHKQIAISVLYLPTLVFWSSGILKDPLCIAAIGWLTYYLYCLIYKNRKVKNLIMIALACWLLVVVKAYILVAYLPFFILFLVFRNVGLIKNKLLKFAIVLTLITISVFGLLIVVDSLQSSLGKFIGKEGLSETIKTYQVTYANQQDIAESNFSLGVEFDGTAGSIIKMAPAAIVATLYRPFLWESKKLSTLMSSIESLIIMFFTIYVILKVGIWRFFRTILRSPIILYSFLFALLFAVFVGATTLNFGTLVRYKIPAMPFYVFSLFLILYLNGKMKWQMKLVAE